MTYIIVNRLKSHVYIAYVYVDDGEYIHWTSEYPYYQEAYDAAIDWCFQNGYELDQ